MIRGARVCVTNFYFGVWSQHSYVSVRKLSDSFPEDTPTHTGQKWERGDTRMARYIGKQKELNPRFAIKLLSEESADIIDNTHVYCSGGTGALGHPKVYINLDKPQLQSCGYCGNVFVAKQFEDLVKQQH